MNAQANLWQQTSQTPIWQTSGSFSSWEVDIIQDISERIIQVFDDEIRINIRNSQEDFNNLFHELVNEIDNIYKNSKFREYGIQNYQIFWIEDYQSRLCQSDDYKIQVFNDILDNSITLKTIVDKILSYLPLETRVLVMNWLIEEYFDDMIYESMDIEVNCDWWILDTSYFNEYINWRTYLVKNFFKNKKIEIDISIMGSLFDKFKQKIINFFERISNAKCVSIAGNNLPSMSCHKVSSLNKEWLIIIFENLNNVKSLDLSSNELYRLDEDSLKIIFDNLIELKYLSLWNNNLHLMDDNQLRIIFGNLKRLKFYENWTPNDMEFNNFTDRQLQLISSLLGDKVLTNL